MIEWYEETFGVEFNKENVETDTEYHISYVGDTLLVIFHGSTSITDWVYNLKLFSTPYKDMAEKFYVHTGFLKKWKSIQHDVMSHVKSVGIKKVKLRGHSQGGALATLCHEDIKFNHPNIKVDTITFGCPRLFAKEGWDVIQSRCSNVVRIINGNDMVPKLPFEFMGYKHVGTELLIGRRGFPWVGPFDHRILSYKKSIEKYEK